MWDDDEAIIEEGEGGGMNVGLAQRCSWGEGRVSMGKGRKERKTTVTL